MISFRSYLLTRRNSPTGEFVRQSRDEPAMEQIESWPQLQAYIYRKAHPNKVKDIIRAAEPVWKGYRALVLKDRRSK
jgi:hypothetical protein